MSRIQLILLATFGSVALLGGAFLFQAFGYAPCHLCLLQRWPHAAAIAFGVLALLVPVRWMQRGLAALGGLAALTTAGLGLYHTGVERKWWLGPDTCTSGDISGMATSDLLDKILNAPLIRCDEAAWSMLGVSMASWNMVFSLVLVAVWIAAYRRS